MDDPWTIFRTLSAFLPGEEPAARAELFRAAAAAYHDAIPAIDDPNLDTLAKSLPSPFAWIAAPAAVAAMSSSDSFTLGGRRIDQWARLRELMPSDVRLAAGPVLSVLLVSLARRPRAEFLKDIGALAPLIGDCGGLEALRRTVEAIEEIATWWP